MSAPQFCPLALSLLNVGGDEAVGVRELAERISRVMVGTRPLLEFVDGPEPGGWVADCSRLRSRFALEPLLPLDEGLRTTADAWIRLAAV
jgi:nucleoside-diphosphate-sugar epimerase